MEKCVRLALLIILAAFGRVCTADILVTSANANAIFRFDQTTGAFIQKFDNSSVQYPYGLAYGPDGYLYAATTDASAGSNSHIDRYDPVSGHLLASFGALPQTRGMTIGPDGLIYVTAFLSNQVWRYNPLTSAFVDIYIPNVAGPHTLTFGPDGNLYICSPSTDSVFKYNSQAQSLSQFIYEPGLAPSAITFGPDGNAYVGSANSYATQVRRYFGSSGLFDTVFATSPNLNQATALTFGPDGNLYVASSQTASVLRFSSNGTPIDIFLPSGAGGLGTNLTGILFSQSNAVTDFSISQNPNGSWSFGYTQGFRGTFTLHSTPQPHFLPGLDRWGTLAVDPSFTLAVTKNNTGSPVPNQTVPPTLNYPPDMLTLHPLPGLYDIVRWTAPTSAIYSVQGRFAGLDTVTSVADTDVHIIRNGSEDLLPGVVLRGLGTRQTFSYTLSVNAGETLDFAVGDGPSGVFQNDSTGLAVTIAPVFSPGVSVGSISITSTPSGAGFQLSGPNGSSYSGKTPYNIATAPTGKYTITWLPLAGYITPLAQSQSLSAGEILPFGVKYEPKPSLIIPPKSLSFEYPFGSGGPLNPQLISVSSTAGSLPFTVSFTTMPPGGAWLTLSQSSGTATTSGISVSVTAALGLPVGTYTGNLVFSSPFAANSPLTLPVSLVILPVNTMTTLLDPVPTLLNAVQKNDVDTLATQGTPVNGFAADGVARLVLRIPAATVGENFRLTILNDEGVASSNLAYDGGLSAIAATPTFSNSTIVTAQSTSSGPNAFAFFEAPVDFSRPGFTGDPLLTSRLVSVEIRSAVTGNLSIIPVRVVRPPVLFVHGLWSNPGAWLSFCPEAANGNECSALLNLTFSSFFIDYQKTNDQSFIDNAPTAYRQLIKQLADFKRSTGVAAVQFDVIAHSMGGLVMKAVVTETKNYLKESNFFKGHIHKLITIDTPHWGSPLARNLRDSGDACKELFSINHMSVTHGAIDALIPGSMDLALLYKWVIPLKTHVLVGEASIDQAMAVERNLDIFSFSFSINGAKKTVVHEACSNPQFGQPLLPPGGFEAAFWGEPSDLIVPESSQLGLGLGYFKNDIPGDISAVHSVHTVDPILFSVGPDVLSRTISEGKVVGGPSSNPQKVIDLLNTWIESASFGDMLP